MWTRPPPWGGCLRPSTPGARTSSPRACRSAWAVRPARRRSPSPNRAAEHIFSRRHVEKGLAGAGLGGGNGARIASNYFDLAMIMDYWSEQRLNHHTEAASMLFAARECARVVLEEGLPVRFARHAAAGRAVVAAAEAMGLQVYGDPAHRMTNVTALLHPRRHRRGAGADADAHRLRDRDRHGLRPPRRQGLAHRGHGREREEARRPHHLRRPGGPCCGRRASASLPARASMRRWRRSRPRRHERLSSRPDRLRRASAPSPLAGECADRGAVRAELRGGRRAIHPPKATRRPSTSFPRWWGRRPCQGCGTWRWRASTNTALAPGSGASGGCSTPWACP